MCNKQMHLDIYTEKIRAPSLPLMRRNRMSELKAEKICDFQTVVFARDSIGTVKKDHQKRTPPPTPFRHCPGLIFYRYFPIQAW